MLIPLLLRSAIISLLAAITLSGCSGRSDGGGSNPSSSTPSVASPTERIVYRADQDTDEVFELYLVGSLIKLNPPLPTGQSVVDFAITPDRSAVVYRANQDTADAIELYRVEFAQPGVSKKLNPMLPLGGDVNAFQIAADSSSVIYVADQAADEVHELYRVSFAAPGISTKLNGPLAPGGNVFFGFSITPDNASVVYSAAQDTANTVELYRVFLATPELSTKLNGLLPTDADVSSLSILPNNSGVVYTVSRFLPTSPGSQFSFLTSELYFVSFSTPGGAFKLNAPLAPFAISYILSFRVTPDSSSVVYLTANSSGDQRQLFRVRFASPGTVDKLHGSDVYALHYRVTPDSTAAVFAGNGIGVSVSSPSFPTELYLAPFSTPGTNTKLNGPLAGNLGLLPFNGAFEITRNGLAAVYVAREKVSTSELYMVPFSTPGLSTTLNGSTVAGGGVYPFGSLELTPDSTGVLYQANQTTPGTTELYRVEFANPGVSTKLNGSLVSGGNVEGGLVR